MIVKSVTVVSPSSKKQSLSFVAVVGLIIQFLKSLPLMVTFAGICKGNCSSYSPGSILITCPAVAIVNAFFKVLTAPCTVSPTFVSNPFVAT